MHYRLSELLAGADTWVSRLQVERWGLVLVDALVRAARLVAAFVPGGQGTTLS